ncbi:glutamate receptor-interacting protein 2 isoform X7 [Tachysurus ichikawai]
MDRLLYVVRRMSPRKRERSFQWEAESPETCDESLCSLSLCISESAALWYWVYEKELLCAVGLMRRGFSVVLGYGEGAALWYWVYEKGLLCGIG